MFGNELKELKDRFFGERPRHDPDREKERSNNDGLREMCCRAESAAQVGPVMDATLEPVTAPENVMFGFESFDGDMGPGNDVPDPGRKSQRIHERGASSGVEMGTRALVEEAGWSHQEAEQLREQVVNGHVTEEQFMREVEQEMENASANGSFGRSGSSFQSAERLARGNADDDRGLL